SLHRPVGELGGVDVAVDVVRLDHADGLLQLGRVDTPGRMMNDVRQHVRKCLVRINAEAEGDDRDTKDGNAPKGVAELHLMSLTEPLSRSGEGAPSSRARC